MPHRDSQGYYRALGLEPDATEEQIQLAYEAIGERPPADRVASMSEVERAYSVLKNPASRMVYDRTETSAPRHARKRYLNDLRVLAACLALLVGILGLVWLPLYGGRFRTFSAGDRLVDLDGASFGIVVQSHERHPFPGGALAPAYLVEMSLTKELRWFPVADLQAACRRSK